MQEKATGVLWFLGGNTYWSNVYPNGTMVGMLNVGINACVLYGLGDGKAGTDVVDSPTFVVLSGVGTKTPPTVVVFLLGVLVSEGVSDAKCQEIGEPFSFFG